MEKIYYGGSILTMESPDDRPEAVLVRDGLFAKVGTLDEITRAAGPDAQRVDLDGKCLMPSFIDPHSHIVMAGQMSLFADLGSCSCFADIQAVMRKYIADNQVTADSVAVGFGYDHNFLAEQDHPGKAVLDQVSTDIPILLIHVSGHLGCANSKMLELAGYNSETPDPAGGKLGRVEGTTEPNGYMEEGAMVYAQQVMGAHIKTDMTKILSNMQDIYLKHGITTTQDGATMGDTMKLLRLAGDTGRLQMDVVAYPVVSDHPEAFCEENKEYLGGYRNHVRIGGYKMLLDGSPQGKSAWMSEPYVGEGDYCAYPWLTQEEANRFAKMAVDNNMQLLTHCNGDAASEQLLDAYEYALAESTNENKYNLRPVMIHCQTVRDDQLDRMKKIGMIASIFVGHVYFWGDVHIKNLGQARGSRVSPVKSALDRGLSVNFHQDTPITKPDMLHSVWCAVNRVTRSGKVIGPEQRADVYNALKAVTINCAYEYSEEDVKGSIKEGKHADLVILDKNPMDVAPMSIKDIQVLETIKDGQTLYKK